ncbi:hypothetical protein [Romboutsia ilealis]|uniref:hypothetical protein n=1 Tax=Romboutsia ilealis TaxID=1115758 RepID=UPI00272B774A|nr:hypothetical protein [Romboutsia ilealis]
MENDKLTQIRNEVESKLKSLIVPPIDKLNNTNTAVSSIQSMMDSIYGEGEVEVNQHEENENIINIRFKETLLINEINLGGV